MLTASAMTCLAEPVRINANWQVSYPAAAKGRPGTSTAVPVNGDAILVSVLSTGTDASRPSVRMGNQSTPAQILGADPVSRLGFVKVKGPVKPKKTLWANNAARGIGVPLNAQTAAGPVKCRATGWVNQIGGKVLPLALLRVNFEKSVPAPAPGTPISDSSGQIIGLVFQAAGGGNTGYAIPAEAVHRVRRDVCDGGHLVRGWLGLSLHAENQSPQVVRVLPNSPAAKAGIRPKDLLLTVGTRKISNYADAANAFFYLIPGEPVRVQILRGAEPKTFTLTPTRPMAKK